MRKVVLAVSVLALLSSCVSKKKYAELEAKNKETQDLLNTCTVKLNTCLEEKAALSATTIALKDQNQNLMETSKEMAILSTKGAQNIEKALESIKEKDLKISRMQDALTRKDSVTLAVVTSLKSAVGLSDPDIEINVEKGELLVDKNGKILTEYRGGGTVIALQPDKFCTRIIHIELQNITYFCAAPPIDGLVIIAHAAEVLVECSQQP
jgi:chemotaxis protein MotB